MKKILGILAIVAFFLSVSPAMAGDDDIVSPSTGSSTSDDASVEKPTQE